MSDPVLDNGIDRLSWMSAVAVILLVQSTAAFLTQIVAVLAPALAQARGWPVEAIGFYAALCVGGSMAVLLFGSTILDAAGPIRSVIVAFFAAAAGVALLAVPGVVAPAGASLLFGAAYGVVAPTGNQMLQRYAPPGHVALMFSIKQAGVPLGAALAGSALPVIAQRAGLAAALGAAAFVPLATIAICCLARRMDGDVDPGAWRVALRDLRPIAALGPFRTLAGEPNLVGLAVVGAALSANQSFWGSFLVTFLVEDRSLGLAEAGFVFTLMQIAAVAGRIGLGFAADRLGSGARVIQAAALLCLPVSIFLALSRESIWATSLVAVAAGATLTGWNGTFLAELARRAPPRTVAQVTAGGLLFVQVGFLLGQLIGAGLLSASAGYITVFLLIAAAPAIASLALLGGTASGCAGSRQTDLKQDREKSRGADHAGADPYRQCRNHAPDQVRQDEGAD